MARKKRKKSSSLFGALVVEAAAVLVFAFLFFQAQSQRQNESKLEREAKPAVQQMFQTSQALASSR